MDTLETGRLVLRDFALTDWEAINSILSDPDVTRFMHFAAWDEGQRRAWLEQIAQEAQEPHQIAYNRAITLRADGLLIGWFGIGGTMHPSEEGTRECGYALGRHWWGQGYMPEAARAVFAYEFSRLGTARIIAECDVLNTASARVMQKSGMHYEGTSYEVDPEGHWAGSHHYSISNKPGD